MLTKLSGPRSRKLLLREFGTAGNRTQDLWVISKEVVEKKIPILWPELVPPEDTILRAIKQSLFRP
jgi:hypothetical protein